MIAVITYHFLGDEVRIHCQDREQFDAAMGYVNDLRVLVGSLDVHVYECVEITEDVLDTVPSVQVG